MEQGDQKQTRIHNMEQGDEAIMVTQNSCVFRNL